MRSSASRSSANSDSSTSIGDEDRQKGGGASDDARDIEADLVTQDVDGETRLDHWFVDSKHHEKAVPPSALEPTLAWASAERPAVVLFLVSGFLSNSAKDYLSKYIENNRPSFRVKHWERPQIERLVGEKGDLVSRYLLRSGLRSEDEITAAESDFFDLVWYDRHQLIKAKHEEGGEDWEANLLKKAEAAARGVEERLGIEAVGPHSEFEWGMLNGKLSALRWVLGEDWDMLDT